MEGMILLQFGVFMFTVLYRGIGAPAVHASLHSLQAVDDRRKEGRGRGGGEEEGEGREMVGGGGGGQKEGRRESA